MTAPIPWPVRALTLSVALLLAACAAGTPQSTLAPPMIDIPSPLRTFVPRDGQAHPLVLLVPGCEAPLLSSRAAIYARTAALLRDAGYAVAIVAYPGAEAGSPDCRQAVPPSSIAASIVLAADSLRAMPGVDAGRMHLVGWSWGARGVLDVVAAPTRLPGLVSAAVFYPACPTPEPWRSAVTLQMFLGQTDTVDPPAQCGAWAGKTDGPGPVALTRYVGVGHGFDIDEAGDPRFAPYRTGMPVQFDASTAYQSRIDLKRFLGLALPGS